MKNTTTVWMLVWLVAAPALADKVKMVAVPSLPIPAPLTQDLPTPGQTLTIPMAVHLALEHNPDIVNSATQIMQAQASLRIAEETLFPTASANLNGNYESTGGVGGSGFGSLQLSEEGGITVNKTISDFGQTRARIVAAESGLSGARALLLQKQEDTALTTRQQYYTAIGDGQLAHIDQDAVDDQSKHIAQAEAFYREGTKARLDVAQAETSAATARLALVSAEVNRDKDYVNLNLAMGLASAVKYQLDDALIQMDEGTVPTIPDVEPLVDEGCRMRPDMLNLQTEIQAADANLTLAHMGFNPILAASGNGSIFAVAGQTTPGFGLGVTLSIPLLDAGATKAAVEAALATLNGLQAQRVSLHNTMFQAVQNDLLTLRQAYTSVDVARTGAASAGLALHLANGRYQAGLASSLDVLDAQVANSTARSALVTAEVQVRVAQAQLDHDTGNIDFLQPVAPPIR